VEAARFSKTRAIRERIPTGRNFRNFLGRSAKERFAGLSFKSQGAAIVNDVADFAGTNGCYLYQGQDVKENKDRSLKDQILHIFLLFSCQSTLINLFATLYYPFCKKSSLVRVFYELLVRSISPPELYNGIGGERTVENLNLNYMGAMLKSARNEANLKQDVLSERVGITTRYLMAIENEGKCPALDVWFRLIRALHISADDIVYPEKAADKVQNEQLLYMIRSLNSRDRKIVQDLMQSMLDNQ